MSTAKAHSIRNAALLYGIYRRRQRTQAKKPKRVLGVAANMGAFVLNLNNRIEKKNGGGGIEHDGGGTRRVCEGSFHFGGGQERLSR